MALNLIISEPISNSLVFIVIVPLPCNPKVKLSLVSFVVTIWYMFTEVSFINCPWAGNAVV